MLEPIPFFKPYQFVQKIEFKNKDNTRHDLGLDYFGFVKRSHVIERTTIEYEVIFAQPTDQPVLEYSLRALSDLEIQNCLEQITKSPEKYKVFIEAINGEPTLKMHSLSLFPDVSKATQLALQ